MIEQSLGPVREAAGSDRLVKRNGQHELTMHRADPEAVGIEKVLEHKYYVDEAYDIAIVQPTVVGSREVLWKVVDVGLIDGLFVNGSALFARAVGWLGSRLQSGQVGTYAWVLLIGALALLGVFTRSS